MEAQNLQNFKEQEEKQNQKQPQAKEKKISICKKCHAPLEEGALFCTECGEKIDGVEKICPICSFSSSSEYCPNCGYKLIPTICPKCGSECHDEICENCNEILDEQLKINFKQKKQAENKVLREAPKEILQDYIQNVQNREKTEEEKEFFKKMEEHKTLLEEREYFNNREKRIIQKFGTNLFGVKLLDPVDTSYASKVYDSLSKIMINRQTKLENEELQKLFPNIYKKQLDEEKYQQELAEKQSAELNKKLLEVEQKYKDILDKTSAEFTDSYQKEQERIRIEEEKRREEERIRKEQEEKKKREEEKRKQEELEYKRFQQKQIEQHYKGKYVCQYKVHFIEITKVINGQASGFYGDYDGTNVASFTGTITGNSFSFYAQYNVKGSVNHKYIYGHFSSNGNLNENSGMCSEPLFRKFY